jgi:hypothetical protein
MGPGFEDSVRQVIGVVGDTKNSGLDSPAPGILYLPAGQIPDMLTRMGQPPAGHELGGAHQGRPGGRESFSKKILGHLVSEMGISQLVRMRRQLHGGSMSECVVTLDSFPR